MTPPEDAALHIVRQWIEKADGDFQAGKRLLSPEDPLCSQACFCAQQAAEKYLKALLSWHRIEFPKTHSIEQLLDLLATECPEIAANLDDATTLTSYGVDIRYPGDQPEPSLDESKYALELAQKVCDTVRSVLPGIS
jgi:HEPN domain-containing protein